MHGVPNTKGMCYRIKNKIFYFIVLYNSIYKIFNQFDCDKIFNNKKRSNYEEINYINFVFSTNIIYEDFAFI